MKRHGITQAGVAARIGRHRSTVSNFLAGRFKSKLVAQGILAAISEAARKGGHDGAPQPDGDGPGPAF
jgi:ParB-like chromosome segregation protein Spo0J